jgi:two-component system cell cycle response regulator DivK
MPQRKPGSLSVLVVDDYPDGLDLVAEYLRFRNFSVHVATDGKDAIKMARTIKPDIVLMDLSMPGIDGWQATTILKNDPATKAICVIAVTAHSMRPERDAALAAGCDGLILKPFDIEKLADALPHVLDDCAKALDVPGLSLPSTSPHSRTRRSAVKARYGS